MAFYAIGEALIDFVPDGERLIPAVGGAPANAAAAFAMLSGKSYFIGKGGEDIWGNKIETELQKKGVSTKYYTRTKKGDTPLAFVSLSEKGERSFSFYRRRTADLMLKSKDFSSISFTKDDILHFGSVSLADSGDKLASSVKKAVKEMKKAGGTTSFDVNIRAALAKNHEKYRKEIKKLLTLSDIVKLSDEDCAYLFGDTSYDTVAESLLRFSKEVLFTFGKNGCRLYTREKTVDRKAYEVQIVDTTGAGDSFIAAYLFFKTKMPPEEALKKASAAAAMVCMKKGVFPALPTLEEVDAFLAAHHE